MNHIPEKIQLQIMLKLNLPTQIIFSTLCVQFNSLFRKNHIEKFRDCLHFFLDDIRLYGDICDEKYRIKVFMNKQDIRDITLIVLNTKDDDHIILLTKSLIKIVDSNDEKMIIWDNTHTTNF